MKKIKTIIITAICIVILFTVPIAVHAEESTSYAENLGYQSLTTDAQRFVYVRMVEGWSNHDRDIDLTLEEGKNVTSEDVKTANAAIKNDFPEFFYIHSVTGPQPLRNGYYISLVYQSPWGSLNDEQQRKNLAEAEGVVNQKVDEILASVSDDVVTDYDKTLWVHDYLVDNIKYQKTPQDQNVYGALVEGECVCAGYANAYTLLLRKLGVKTHAVSGLATKTGERHRWNVSWIDGECVYTDVTWDDSKKNDSITISWANGEFIQTSNAEGNGRNYTYFNISGTRMAINHDAYDWYDAVLPECNHTDHSYKAPTPVKVTSIVLNSNAVILAEAGASVKLSATVLPENAADRGVVYESSDPAVVIVDTDGKLTAIGEGSAVITIRSNDGGAETSCVVTVSFPKPVHQIEAVAEKPASCTESGVRAHYRCTDCGILFQDGNGTVVLDAPATIPALGHTAGDWQNSDIIHWKNCIRCNVQLSENSGSHIDGNADCLCDACNHTLPGQDEVPTQNDNDEAVPGSNGETEQNNNSMSAQDLLLCIIKAIIEVLSQALVMAR